MNTPYELLQDHPLYGLDRAIAGYLAPLLEQKLAEPFRRYRDREDAMTTAAVEATRQLGAGLAGRALTLQEELLARPDPGPALAQAWHELLDKAEGEWRDLCQLYGDVRAELRDLACMAAAQQTAIHSGDSAHAELVCRILGLDSALAPTWLP